MVLHGPRVTSLILILEVAFDGTWIVLVCKFGRSSRLYASDRSFHPAPLHLPLSTRASLAYCALLSSARSRLCRWARIWFGQGPSHSSSPDVGEPGGTTTRWRSKRGELKAAPLIMRYYQSRKCLIATAVVYASLRKTSLRVGNSLPSSARNRKRGALRVGCVGSAWPRLGILALVNYGVTNQGFLACNPA